MKATGIVRKVDDLGRIVLPIELRRTLSIDIKDPLEIYVDGDCLHLLRQRGGCHQPQREEHLQKLRRGAEKSLTGGVVYRSLKWQKS